MRCFFSFLCEGGGSLWEPKKCGYFGQTVQECGDWLGGCSSLWRCYEAPGMFVTEHGYVTQFCISTEPFRLNYINTVKSMWKNQKQSFDALHSCLTFKMALRLFPLVFFFFHYPIDNLWTAHIVHFTYCKDYCGNVIVIPCYFGGKHCTGT